MSSVCHHCLILIALSAQFPTGKIGLIGECHRLVVVLKPCPEIRVEVIILEDRMVVKGGKGVR